MNLSTNICNPLHAIKTLTSTALIISITRTARVVKEMYSIEILRLDTKVNNVSINPQIIIASPPISLLFAETKLFQII